jgi:NADH-quinone oxidoreductase subunit M
VLLGLCIGFGVKLPSFPLHNWLPDAHVEAPTEGSVMLAGVLLKLGAYGFVRIVLQAVPDAAARYGWVLVTLAVVSLIYGALAALAQKDLKRLIAYTSINHMGYVLLATGIFALSRDITVRQLAIMGATFQMVSHGLLTGAMFFLVGILQDQTGTREIARFGGLMRTIPLYSGLLGLVAFGSLGLPGLSGFVAEFQVIGAAVSLNLWVAVGTVIALLITTGLYILVITRVLMGDPSPESAKTHELSPGRLVVVGSLAALSLLLGIVPWILIAVIAPSALVMAGAGV